MPPPGSLSSVSWMLIAALATDLTILGSIEYATRASAASGPSDSTLLVVPLAPPIDAAPAPPPWAMCFVSQTPAQPVRAAITYLHPGRDQSVTAREILSWLGDLDPAAVEVWRLEDQRGERRVSFELPSETWPRWREVSAELVGDALCDRLHADLRAHRVGRPRPAAAATVMDQTTRSRHDVELLSPRRPHLYRDFVRMGTAADLTDDRVAALIAWIDEPEVVVP